jgi:homoserine/homoserine lactone efflux protein
LRTLGAVYLFYLGLNIILGTLRRTPETKALTPSRHPSLFLQGLLIQLTNPKALLFVSALLPQFIRPSEPLGPQAAILAVVTIVIDTTVLTGYAIFAERSMESFRGSRFAGWLERVFGAALLFFGVRLLLSRK